MSKSKKNIVDPDDIIKLYGADTARWFVLSDSPPDRDIFWTEAGIESSNKFINKIWRTILDYKEIVEQKDIKNASEQMQFMKIMHKSIKDITFNLETMSFNKAIANIYSLIGELSKSDTKEKINGQTASKILKQLIIILSPFIPHLAEESWAHSGFDGLVCKQSWPEFDESLTDNEKAMIVVQINGKKRGELSLSITTGEKEAVEVAKNNNKIKNDLAGKEIKKVIYVKGRILNFVV